MKLLSLGLSPPENKETRSNPSTPLAGAWQHLFSDGHGTEAGESVNPHSAMQLAAVNACVSLISSSIASLPLKLYERQGASKVELLGHPVHDLLAFQPSIESTPAVLWTEFLVSVLLHGNGFLEVTRNASGVANGLWFLNPNYVRVYRNPKGDILYDVSEGGQKRTLPASSVIHVPAHPSGDGVTGVSVIRNAANVLGESLALDKFGQRFFRNYATPNVVLKTVGKIKPEDKGKMRSDFEALQSAGNQHRVAILDQDMSIEKISIDPESASWIKSKAFNREQIAGMFHISTQLLSSEARVSGEVYSSQMLAFLELALKPWMHKIHQELLRKLFPGQMSKFIISHDWHSLLKSDPKSMIQSISVARQAGVYKTDELRELMGLNPVGGAVGELILAPVNTADIEKLVGAGPPATNDKIAPVGNADNNEGQQNDE